MISERFLTFGQFASYDPHAATRSQTVVFQLQCRACGFEPENVMTPPRCCPKCFSEAWERFARPGSILENAERF